MPESKLSPRRIEAVHRQQRALELRMAGRTWQEIADNLGYTNHTGAIAAVKTALAKTLQEPSAHYRALTLARLSKIIQVHWPLMLQADPTSTRLCLQAIKDMRDLLGLDSPTKHEYSGPDGGPIRQEVLTLDVADIAEAISVLNNAGAVRVESNGYHPSPVDGEIYTA